MRRNFKTLVLAIAAYAGMACLGTHSTNFKNTSKMGKNTTMKTAIQTSKSRLPRANDFVTSPLRNRIKLELNASVQDVWALVGRLEQMPKYSSGLEKLDANYDANGKCTGYTCHFKPMEEGGEVTTHSETIQWYEPNVGYASLAHEPNLLGLQQSLSLITLKDNGEQTILQWDVHFNAESSEFIEMNVIGFEQALNIDIAQNLISKFGGNVLESFVDNP